MTLSAVEGVVPEWIHVLPSGKITSRDDRGPWTADLKAVIEASFGEVTKIPIDQDHSTYDGARGGSGRRVDRRTAGSA